MAAERDRLLEHQLSLRDPVVSPDHRGVPLRFGGKQKYGGRRHLTNHQTNLSTPIDSSELMDTSDENFLVIQNDVAALKGEVSLESRENFELERRVHQFDVRIGLLVGLRIKVDMQQVERLDFGKLSAIGRSELEKPPTWPNETQLQHYGTLFFLLQTRPHYIANLARQVGAQRIDTLMAVIMNTLYGHHYDAREEHLLLCMFEHALMLEFEQAADVTCVLRQNTAITRMMTSYTRRGPGMEYLRQILTAPIVFLSSMNDCLEIDPVKIYRELVSNGTISTLDSSDVSAAQRESRATDYEEVRQLAAERTKRLEEVLESLLDGIFSSVSTVPHGIRWLCRTILTLVHRHFPDNKETAMSLVGGFFFLRFINPVIVSPDRYSITQGSMSDEARRTLTLVAKVIQKIANKASAAKVKESYMSSFDQFIRQYQTKLEDFLSKLCEVEDFHDYMRIEHFLTFTKNQVILDIEHEELHHVHSLIWQHREKLVQSSNDQLSAVLADVGAPPSSIASSCSKASLRLTSRWNMGEDASQLVDDSFREGYLSQCMSADFASPNLRHDMLISRSISVLMRLFKLVPERWRRRPVCEVIEYTRDSSVQNIQEVGGVAEILNQSLLHNDIVIEDTSEYEEMLQVLPDQESLCYKYSAEKLYLSRIQSLVREHHDYLVGQLKVYKLYLAAAREKALFSARNSAPADRQRRSNQPQQFSVATLLRMNIVVSCPMHKRNSLVEVVAPSPGQYLFTMISRHTTTPSMSSTDSYDGSSRVSLELLLENLLELRVQSSPTFTLDGNIAFDANNTLFWLQRSVR